MIGNRTRPSTILREVASGTQMAVSQAPEERVEDWVLSDMWVAEEEVEVAAEAVEVEVEVKKYTRTCIFDDGNFQHDTVHINNECGKVL